MFTVFIMQKNVFDTDDAQKISRLNGCLEGLKRKKNKIKGDRGKPIKNPLMLKLVFSLELRNSNFRSGGNLSSFDVDESLYSEFLSGFLFGNFLNVDGS